MFLTGSSHVEESERFTPQPQVSLARREKEGSVWDCSIRKVASGVLVRGGRDLFTTAFDPLADTERRHVSGEMPGVYGPATHTGNLCLFQGPVLTIPLNDALFFQFDEMGGDGIGGDGMELRINVLVDLS